MPALPDDFASKCCTRHFDLTGLGSCGIGETSDGWPRCHRRIAAHYLLVGYRKVPPIFTTRAYVSLDYERHDLNPYNSLDSNHGSHAGDRV
jgi:hypothetical protein